MSFTFSFLVAFVVFVVIATVVVMVVVVVVLLASFPAGSFGTSDVSALVAVVIEITVFRHGPSYVPWIYSMRLYTNKTILDYYYRVWFGFCVGCMG